MIQDITLAQVLEWQEQQIDFQLIDVREPDEHQAYNIGGILIPLSEILKQRHQLQLQHPIVFYCKRGIRSQIAIQKLKRFFPEGDFYNLKSGIGTSKNSLS